MCLRARKAESLCAGNMALTVAGEMVRLDSYGRLYCY